MRREKEEVFSELRDPHVRFDEAAAEVTEQSAVREAPGNRNGRPTDKPRLNHRATLRLYSGRAGKLLVVRDFTLVGIRA